MNFSEQSANTSNTESANKMRTAAIWLLVIGIIGTLGVTELFIQLNLNYQELFVVLRFINRVSELFALPLSAALFVGAMIVRRLPERP